MSGRKRKSLWDSKEETEIPAEFSKHDVRHGRGNHSSHHATWSELEANNAIKSNNRSRWSSAETWQDNNERRDFNEILETNRAVGGAKSYSRSPGFDGRGRQNHSPSSEIYWSQSNRYQRSRSSSRSKGRAGSRSRSRSRSRGRDRDMDKDTDGIRSWSRGRDRDMDKDTDSMRSWSRGRDRDMDKDPNTNWSNSSLRDNRREYNGMGDRKSGARVSSQVCRDFAAGMCRRGGQCRFLHQDNLNLRDEGKPERERAERWRGRQETGDAFSADNERLRYRALDKVSNYDRSNRSSSFDHDHRRQPHKNGNIPCKYFAMGRCHRDDCRFSHDHSGGGGVKERLQYERYAQHSGDENKYRNGPKWGDANGVSDMNINEWSDSDAGNMNYTDRTNAKKQDYGRLDRDLKDENISWNGPKWSDSDAGNMNYTDRTNAKKQDYGRLDQDLKDENISWNGPKWSDDTGVSNVARPYTDRTTAKKQDYGRQDLKDENISWNGPKWSDVTGASDVAGPNRWVDSNAGSASFPELPIAEIKTDERFGHSMDHMMQNRAQSGSNVANVDTSESTHVATFDREVWVDAQGSHFQPADGTSLQTCEKVIEGASTQQLANNVGHPLVSETSHVKQHDSKRGNNDMSTDDSNTLNGVSISGNPKLLLVPDHSFNQNGGSLGSLSFKFHDTDQRNVIPVSPLKGHETDLNRSDKQLLYLNPQDESKILCEESTNKQQVFESEVPQVDPGLLQTNTTGYQVATITNLSASLNEIFSNGKQLPELYAALNPRNSTDLLTSLSCSASVNPPVPSTVGQPNPTIMFREQHVPIGDTIESSKHDKSDKPYELGKPNPLVSVLPSFAEGPGKHSSNNKPYPFEQERPTAFEQERPTPFEHILPSSTDRIGEDVNNNKPYELGEPKPLDQFLLSSTAGSDSGKLQKICSPVKECQGSPKLKQLKPVINLKAHQNFNVKAEKCKPEEEIPSDNANPEGGVREGNCGKDEKEMRLFKVALVEYVKEILKPTWKEGQMSREVHKSIVKKVVDKVTSTIQGVHVPKTQEKVDQYLACSKPKLTKLVQAYTERLLKS